MDIPHGVDGYKVYVNRVREVDGEIWLFPSPKKTAGKNTSAGQGSGKGKAVSLSVEQSFSER